MEKNQKKIEKKQDKIQKEQKKQIERQEDIQDQEGYYSKLTQAFPLH